MTGQFTENLGPLKDCCKGAGLWIVGSGPSIDQHDLSKLDGQYVFALNASILFTAALNAEVWWIYWDNRVFYELRSRLFALKPHVKMLRAIVNRRGEAQMREYRGQSRFIRYSDQSFKPDRSVLEVALKLAKHLGFDEVYTLGIDGFVDDEGRGYCNDLNWKQVRFINPAKPKLRSNSTRDFMKSLSALELGYDVFRVSDLFPSDGPFVSAEFDECLKRSKEKLNHGVAKISANVGQVVSRRR